MSAEQTAQESENKGEGVEVDHFDVAREIEVALVGGVKCDETVFELIESTWREHTVYAAISGEAMVKELVDAARKVEIETLKESSGLMRASSTRRARSIAVGWSPRRSRGTSRRTCSQRPRRWRRRKCFSIL